MKYSEHQRTIGIIRFPPKTRYQFGFRDNFEISLLNTTPSRFLTRITEHHPTTRSVSFAWTQLLAGAPALAAFPNVTIGGTSLVGQTLGAALPGLDIRAGAAAFAIPGFAATVGRTYVFQVTMTTVVRLASQSVASAPTSVSALVAVRFVAAPLVARIEGGDRQGMGSGMHTGAERVQS